MDGIDAAGAPTGKKPEQMDAEHLDATRATTNAQLKSCSAAWTQDQSPSGQEESAWKTAADVQEERRKQSMMQSLMRNSHKYDKLVRNVLMSSCQKPLETDREEDLGPGNSAVRRMERSAEALSPTGGDRKVVTW